MMASKQFIWIYLVYHALQLSVSQLCDSSEYCQNIENILQKEIGDKYDIIHGKLFWVQNNTKWANNPSGIYGVYMFPYSSGLTTYDESPDIIFHAHDAILFSGCTPPISRYYSAVNYLFNRYQSNRDIEWLFASLGASLNHLAINISENNSKFNNLVSIIHTGDNKTYSDIYSALIDTNFVSKDSINLLNIPHEYFNFSPYYINNKNYILYNETFDSFLPLWRIALPLNKTEFNEYININQTGIWYLKYKNQSNYNDIKPFSKYDPYVRDTYSPYSLNETIYANDFNQYVDALIHNITETYDYKYHNQTINFRTTGCKGFCCINNSINNNFSQHCMGDNRDDMWSDCGDLTLSNHTSFIVVGVNANKLNETVYQSIDYELYGGDILDQSSPKGITNFDFQDSVINLNIPTNISKDSLDKFYLVQFSRPNTFIPGIIGFNITEQMVNESEKIQPIERHYLNPVTHTRPDMDNMLQSVIIIFKKPN